MKFYEHNPIYVNFSWSGAEVNLIKALSFTDKESNSGLNGLRTSITK